MVVPASQKSLSMEKSWAEAGTMGVVADGYDVAGVKFASPAVWTSNGVDPGIIVEDGSNVVGLLLGM